jgi:DNA-binding transcriptional MerR regulator
MTQPLSMDALCAGVNDWCDAHGVSPASGQAGERLTERSIRYYRTLGLVDGPEAGGGYGAKALLQLMAVRLLQSRGLPLRRIRELLFGRGLTELQEICDRGLAEAEAARPPLTRAAAEELWRVMPLDDEFLLVSRRGAAVTAAQLDAIRAALRAPTPRLA